MSNYLKQIFTTWKRVFRNWRYIITAIVISITFYSFNVLILNWKNLTTFYTNFGGLKALNFLFVLLIGFKSTITHYSFISLIVISIFFSIFACLIFYKLNFNISIEKKVGFFGGFGIFLGALAPGCVACGFGLVSTLGIMAGFLAFLPFEGLELSIFSMGLLSFAILKISSDMYKCDISLEKTNRNERRLI